VANTVLIHRRWPDGDVLQVQVEAESSFPDAIAEARAAALATYREALGLTLRGNE